MATRRALLDAAAELIPELGWGSVTTRAIAERAGVRPGLVHYHFDSVDALLVAAVVDTASALVDGFDQLLAGADDVRAGVDLLVAETAAVVERPAMLLLTEASLAAPRIPALRGAVADVMGRVRSRIAAWLTGHGHTEDRAAVTAAVVTAALDGWALHRAADPTLDPDTFRAGLHALVTADEGATP